MSNTKFLQSLQAAVAAGSSIEFTANSDVSDYAEPGMRAKLLATSPGPDGTATVKVDFSPFESHNIPLETSTFYDKNGIPGVSARDLGIVPTVETLFVNEDGSYLDFKVLPAANQAFLDEFVASGATSYVSFLEEQLVLARSK